MLFGLPIVLVQSSIRLATPYVLGSLAALVASRAGVLNLAIEGKMTLGAFVAVAVLYKTGFDPAVGLIAATVAGGVLGFIFAVLYLRVRINLIILALAVNLFIANVTEFIMRVNSTPSARWPTPAFAACRLSTCRSSARFPTSASCSATSTSSST